MNGKKIKPWGVVCVVPTCLQSNRDKPNLKFFKFPDRGTEQHAKWKDACSLQSSPTAKTPYVCSDHFVEKDRGKKRLKKNKIPSIFVPVQREDRFERIPLGVCMDSKSHLNVADDGEPLIEVFKVEEEETTESTTASRSTATTRAASRKKDPKPLATYQEENTDTASRERDHDPLDIPLIKAKKEETTESRNTGTTSTAMPKKDLQPLGTNQEPLIDIFKSEKEDTTESSNSEITGAQALEMLKSLEAYVKRLGNDTVIERFREITAVVQEAVQTEQKPRRGV